jgi:hypothetical protein
MMKRIHFLLGLYLLLFVWLFAISGLVLNHPKWQFADFWPKRQEDVRTATITPVGDSGDMQIARSLMQQIGVTGEVHRIDRAKDGRVTVQIIRPGRTVDISVDPGASTATVKDVRVNAWGKMSALHHFTGVSMEHAERQRDWWITRLWSLAMDAVALGLLVLVITSLYLWWKLKKNRALGFAMLALSTAATAFFLFDVTARWPLK